VYNQSSQINGTVRRDNPEDGILRKAITEMNPAGIDQFNASNATAT
jgi:hypothetical protein